MMATPDEIRRRVEAADTARSARRADTAQKIAELAQRRADLAHQLDEVETALREVLAEAQDVIDVEELAEFTDLKPSDLDQWRGVRRSGRAKRKKPAERADTRRTSPGARPSVATQHDGRTPSTPAQPARGLPGE